QQAYLKASNSFFGDEFGTAVAIDGDSIVVGAHKEDSAATGVNGNQADNSELDSGAAYVFVRSGSTWTQQAYLKSSSNAALPGHAGDNFGASVAVSGDTVVVGAWDEPSDLTGINGSGGGAAVGSGAAYVFVRSGATWSPQAYVKASNTDVGDEFGWSVAISGDTIVVGSWLSDSTPVGSNGGAAYVFQRRPEFEDRWDMVAKLVGSGTTAADRFGTSVAIDGDVIVVGAELDDPVGSASGAAYVFERHAGGANQWNETAALVASGASSGDRFGKSVSVSGGTVIVGSWFDDVGASNSGAAYIFERHNGTWSETAKLSPSSPTANDQFGVSVAASGSTVVVSAWLDDYDLNPFRSNTGAVYVYQRVNAVWQETVRLLPAAPPSSGERLGTSIDIDGDRIAVGAYLADASGVDSGRVLLFARSAAGTWSQQAELHNLGSSTNDRFGNSVAIDRSVIVAGSYLEDAAATNSGAVTVFDLRQDTATVTLSYVEPVSLLPVSQPIAIFSGSNAAAADHPMMPMVRRESAQRSWVHDPLAGARAENAADSSAPKQHRRAHSRSIASNAVIAIDLDEPDWI
ncbi:MAG: FG-GAP repeat protein, partial [Planctomycetales bacterium]|nr:FG-GAP repeat protein [Planctomycetales bacterium]